ncbi:hypothetical protein [Maridesulfovibrio sp. FT414]|uniref:hypothetical protein n=1 Tax=Maridesulfovibrio sp. FT414 TaxID=2979469 RepID=UPI003D807406
MRDNDLYDVILREMVKVKEGHKCPEKAALSVMGEFSKESVYVSTRYLRHAGLAAKVLKLRNDGLETGEIAQRLGISKRHARRLYASMMN